MPSFSLTPAEVATFCCLPGRALLKVLPAEQKIGSIHLPETAAEREQHRQPAREGVVIKINARPHTTKDLRTNMDEIDKTMLAPLDHGNGRVSVGARVLYLTHADEVDNQFVVVLHGQILAILYDR